MSVLGQSVLSAYNAYNGLALNLPTGWKVNRGITGWAGIVGGEELFALVLVPTSGGSTAIVAIRGTQSVADWIEDLYSILPTPFTPFPGGVTPLPTPQVGDGFLSVYADIGGNRSGKSMQQQLFDTLNSLPALTQLIVTGHSLGSALAELFMFDYALQRAAGKYAKQSAFMVNYAAPCCGDATWVQQYASFTQGLFSGPWPQTTRIVNQDDVVPYLPPNLEQPAVEFDVRFRRNTIFWEPFVGNQHAMVNYNLVINKALPLPGQTWTGYFTEPGTTVSMVSLSPNSSIASVRRERLNQLTKAHRDDLDSVKTERNPNAVVHELHTGTPV